MIELPESQPNQDWHAVDGPDGDPRLTDFVNEVIHTPGFPEITAGLTPGQTAEAVAAYLRLREESELT